MSQKSRTLKARVAKFALKQAKAQLAESQQARANLRKEINICAACDRVKAVSDITNKVLKASSAVVGTHKALLEAQDKKRTHWEENGMTFLTHYYDDRVSDAENTLVHALQTLEEVLADAQQQLGEVSAVNPKRRDS